MSVIYSRAPLRISLGGGGTDLPSYYRDHGGFLVAGAIDKYVYMLTHTAFQRRYRMKYAQFEEVDEPSDIRHPILREALMRHWRGEPLEIVTTDPALLPRPRSRAARMSAMAGQVLSRIVSSSCCSLMASKESGCGAPPTVLTTR